MAHVVDPPPPPQWSVCDENPAWFDACQQLGNLGTVENPDGLNAGARLGSPALGLLVAVFAAIGLGL